jgi:uncharacterized protein
MLRMLLAALVIAMSPPAHAQNRDQALIAAAGKGDLLAVERLIREGASVAARDGRGRTALLAATHGNHVPVARALIEAGADVNAKDDMQDSPFLYAGAEGRIEILTMTLPTADLKSTNRYGGTALIPAAHHGHTEAVRILLATPIDKDHVNRLGWTALLEAVILGDGGAVHAEIVRLLVEAGANVNIADREGVASLQHAKRRGYAGMVRILEARGAR